MPAKAPANANEFIEQQLDERARAIGTAFGGDLLTFTGGIGFGVDDIIRKSIEGLNSSKSKRSRLLVVLTTNGGFIETAQRIAELFRHHYRKVEFIIPNYAYSAGTVLCVSGDAIHMDYYSRLGPIDTQVQSQNGDAVPALGYLAKWTELLSKANDGTLTGVEAQLMIDGFDQAELYKYEQAQELSVELLKEWLVKYKFRDWKVTETRGTKVTRKMKIDRAEKIARELNNTDRWHSHGYGISMEVLRRNLNLVIDDYGNDSSKNSAIQEYYDLLDDYMSRIGTRMIVHTPGSFIPIT